MLDREMMDVLSRFGSDGEKRYWSNGLGLLSTLDHWDGDWTLGQENFYDQLEERIQDYAWIDGIVYRVKFKGRKITPQEV